MSSASSCTRRFVAAKAADALVVWCLVILCSGSLLTRPVQCNALEKEQTAAAVDDAKQMAESSSMAKHMAAAMEYQSGGTADEEEEDANSLAGKESAERDCGIHTNEQLHGLMDRICELCHDFFSHQRPNTRNECRADCFRSVAFKRCLRLFKPFSRPNRTRRLLTSFDEEQR